MLWITVVKIQKLFKGILGVLIAVLQKKPAHSVFIEGVEWGQVSARILGKRNTL